MEQTVNTFARGLLTDTHPMILGTNTLSDALNATFITMNGNEMILLNDMGNRKIDNAFLPPGYEPVGIKEYGGIIYLAIYNPITNKSLIGSFPSPERKMGNEYKDLKTTLDFSALYQPENESSSFLKDDTILIPITKDMLIHAGDKFSIYSGNLIDKTFLSNYDNITTDNKVVSPKNRLFTLSVGILNSQNEFVDITNTLERWNNSLNNSLKIDTSALSSLVKFNTGYFIAKTDTSPSLSGDDQNFLLERLKLAINTYSYKLVGPMYLKSVLNHPTNFNYNIYGIYSDVYNKQGKVTGKEATLWLEGIITYNCPDTITSNTSVNDLDYYTYQEGLIDDTFIPFDFVALNQDTSQKIVSETYYNGTTKYSKSDNSYTVRKIIKYTKIVPSLKDILNYQINVLAIPDKNVLSNFLGSTSNNNRILYLKNLSVEGSLDLSALGSGQIKLNGWRFYNTNELTILTFTIDAYPEFGKKFDDLVFTFEDITDALWQEQENNKDHLDEEKIGDVLYYPRQITHLSWALHYANSEENEDELNSGNGPLHAPAGNYDGELEPIQVESKSVSEFIIPINNGRTTLYLNWDEVGLKPRRLYRVTAQCKKIDNPDDILTNVGTSSSDTNDKIDIIKNDDYYWLLTTPLFNEHFAPDSVLFVSNFCKVNRTTNSKFYDKMKANLEVQHSFTNRSETITVDEIDDKLIQQQETSLEIKDNPLDWEDPGLDNPSEGDGEGTGETEPTGDGETQLPSENNKTLTASLTYKLKLDFSILDSPTLHIKDEELYPETILLNDANNIKLAYVKLNLLNEDSIDKILAANADYSSLFTANVDGISYSPRLISQGTHPEMPVNFIEIEKGQISGNLFKINIYSFDRFKSNSTETTEEVTNVFDTITSTIVEDANGANSKQLIDLFLPADDNDYGGIALGLRDNKYLDIYGIINCGERVEIDEDDDEDEIWTISNDYQYFHNRNDHGDYKIDQTPIEFSDFITDITNTWNLLANTNLEFIYIFGDTDFASNRNYREWIDENKRIYGRTNARVWWKTLAGEWALLNEFYARNTTVESGNWSSVGTTPDTRADFKNWIISKVFNDKNFVYCVYPKRKINNLYVPDFINFIYNDLYNIKLAMTFHYAAINQNIALMNSFKFGNFELSINGDSIYTPENSDISVFKDIYTLNLNLKSNQTFLDRVYMMLLNGLELSNLYITGLSSDVNGKALNPNAVYLFDDTKNALYPITNSYNKFHIDFDNPIEANVLGEGMTYINRILYGGWIVNNTAVYESPTVENRDNYTHTDSSLGGRSGTSRDTYKEGILSETSTTVHSTVDYTNYFDVYVGKDGYVFALSYKNTNTVDVATPLIIQDHLIGIREIDFRFRYNLFTVSKLGELSEITRINILINNKNLNPITYSSSNTAIAEVNSLTGVVTAKTNGECTITATFAGNEIYTRLTASYTLKINSTSNNESNNTNGGSSSDPDSPNPGLEPNNPIAEP